MSYVYPAKVVLTEVGPRDGLQNEKNFVPTEEKIAMIDALTDAGFSRIEAGSFVSPQWVPQLADSDEVFRKIRQKPGVRYLALVPNFKGLQRALASGARSLALFTAASETFNRKNIRCGIEDSLKNIQSMLQQAKAEKLWVRAYLSTCFSCPYEGAVPPDRVIAMAKRLFSWGVDELSLGDTVGAATPRQVEVLLGRLREALPHEYTRLALHFHDTRGTALANTLIGLQQGIDKFDSSAGGLGGCPYSPGASGNLASEDLLYMLQGMEIATDVDLERVVRASQRLALVLGKALPSKYLQSCKTEAFKEGS